MVPSRLSQPELVFWAQEKRCTEFTATICDQWAGKIQEPHHDKERYELESFTSKVASMLDKLWVRAVTLDEQTDQSIVTVEVDQPDEENNFISQVESQTIADIVAMPLNLQKDFSEASEENSIAISSDALTRDAIDHSNNNTVNESSACIEDHHNVKESDESVSGAIDSFEDLHSDSQFFNQTFPIPRECNYSSYYYCTLTRVTLKVVNECHCCLYLFF